MGKALSLWPRALWFLLWAWDGREGGSRPQRPEGLEGKGQCKRFRGKGTSMSVIFVLWGDRDGHVSTKLLILTPTWQGDTLYPSLDLRTVNLTEG